MKYAGKCTVTTVLLFWGMCLSAQTENWIYHYDRDNMLVDMPYASAYGPDNNIYVAGAIEDSTRPADFLVISLTHEGDTNWTYRYNGPFNGGDLAHAITCGADSHVYVAGISKADSTNYDLAVVRLTPDGLEDWVFRYDGPGHAWDRANAIACGVNGNIYAAGESAGIDGHKGLVVISLTPSGDVNWVYRHERANAHAIVCGADSNVYVAGYCKNAFNNINFAVISMKPSGDVNWIYQYDGPDHVDDEARAIDYGMDGNIYAAGVSYHFGVYGLVFPDVIVVGLTPTGQERWTYRHNGPYNCHDVANDVVYGADSTIYVVGASHVAHYCRDFIVISLTTTGTENWLYRYDLPGFHDGEAHAIGYDAMSNSICATGYSGNDQIGGLTTVNLDPSGDTNWVYIYEGEAGDFSAYGRALEPGTDGNLYVLGFEGGPDIVVISLAVTSGIQVHDNVSSAQPIQLFITPNPFSAGSGTCFRYTLAVPGHVEIAIYNALGQRVRSLVKTMQPQGPHSIMWYGDDDTGQKVAQGAYFYRMSVRDFSTTGKILFLK